MPTYDYKKNEDCEVRDCERYVELQHSVNEVVTTSRCSQCNRSVAVQKCYGVTPVHYKGSGFYVNDYKKADAELRKKYYPRSDAKKYY